MADEEYNKKLESLQQFIPFLDNMIAQLKDPSKKNREQQLSKMESLHLMITDRKKKLKLETLNKCEDVITKLYQKVNHKPFVPKKESDRSPRSTPASPTPEQQSFFKPVTERLEPKSHIPKVDIYSSAAESLRRSKLQESPRYSAGKIPDLSKPPISLDDLKCLEVDVREKINENASLKELNDIRNKIATELIFENIKSIITPTPTTDTTVSSNSSNSKQTNTEATKKVDTFFEPSHANKNITDIKLPDEKSNSKKPLSIILKAKISPKILKEPASIFGNVLSNIDEKIIDKKKFDRRSSTEKTWTYNDSKKERRDSKEEKKSRDDKKSSKEEKKHSKEEKKQYKEDKKIAKEEKKIAKEERRNSKEEKRIAKEEKHNLKKDESNSRNLDSSGKKYSKEKETEFIVQKGDTNNDADLKIGEKKLGSNTYTGTAEKIKTECDFVYDDLDTPTAPIPSKVVNMGEPKVEPNTPYKRLADKYHPKPRKSNVDADVDKAVTDIIEANMKVSPAKLPVMPKPEPPPPPPASLVKCAQQMDVEFKNLQSNVNPPHKNINPLHTNMNPHLNINPPHTNINPPQPLMNSNLIQIQRTPLLCNPPNPHVSPSILMSPRDNFISDYAREDFNTLNHRRPLFESPISVIPSSRFMPPQPQPHQNQMFNSGYNNFNQNHMDPGPPPLLDYQAPQNISSRPYNVGPPLLSPEMPHFHEQKHNFGGIMNRDMFLPKEDLRWRLEDNRPSWDRREFEQQRFRGPMTYKEHRELRENTRDPRLLRDPRERPVPPRETRDFRDPRENRDRDFRDPRENRDIRDPRENRDPREIPRDPREIPRDPREVPRDPRENRDVRVRDPRDSSSESRDREIKDPRLNRDKFQELKEKESKEKESKERENKDSPEKSNRDPRLNREGSDFERGRSRNRYESTKFDRIYSTTNKDNSGPRSPRSESRSKSAAEKKESFISPLDSLYTGKEEHKTGKGYGVQQFRIPKKKIEKKSQIIDLSEEKIDNDNVGASRDESPSVEKQSEKELDREYKNTKAQDNKATPESNAESNLETKSEKENIGILSGTQKIAPEETTNSLDLDHDAPVKSQSETVTQAQTSSKNDESKPPTEQTILAHFFTNLLSSQNKKDKKTALYSLISTFSDTFSSKELEKITKIINTNEEEAVSDEDDHTKEKEEKPTSDTDDSKNVAVEPEEAIVEQNEKVDDNRKIEHEDETEPVFVPNISKRKLRSRRISSCSSSIDKSFASTETSILSESIEDINDADAPSTESSENVIVSVGERIKSRRRIASKPKKKCRSELDKLHEDIQEMFIRDGVLTASGRRMCNLLKDDPCVLTTESELKTNEEEAAAAAAAAGVVKTRKKPGPKPKSKSPNESEVKAMKNVRVIIQKIPEMEKTSVARRLTRSMTVIEGQEDDETSGSSKEDTGEEDTVDENSDTEKDTLSQTSSDTHKSKEKKRKRLKSSWASGIIKKKKKKQPNADDSTSQKSPEPESEENAEHSMGDFLTPDKNYYVDFASQKTYACRLCDFQGKFITTHYKTIHPESEVMSSRFSPSISAEAIEDAKKNLDKYEKYQEAKPSVRIFYICRFCDFNTTVVPTLFYDHLSTHTGEYRHICPTCSTAFCNAKSLKSHLQNSHPEQEFKPVPRKAFNSTIQFGYLCGECNYVQISKTNLDEHVNIYHLEKPLIYKVNLSSHVDEKIKLLYEEKLEREKAALEESSQKEPDIVTEPTPAKEPVKSNEKKKNELRAVPDLPESTKAQEVPTKMKKPKRNKPGPKSKKKFVEKSEPTVPITNEHSSGASEANTPKTVIDKPKFSRSDSTLDTEKILPFRSKRAAKEKAQEKLKEIMEVNESSQRKKSNPEENKSTKGTQAETDLNTKNKKEENKDNTSPIKDSSVTKETVSSETDSNSVREEIVKEPPQTITPNDLAKVVKKEIEMNVFTCNTDIQEENKKIEQERLQKMDELNKSFGSRTSLNFTDKLCNRLNQDVPVKEEPKDDFIDTMYLSVRNKSPIPMPVLEKNPSTMGSTERTSVQIKKPVLESVDSHVATPTFDVAQKNDRNIMNMIEKLKGKLGADDNFKLDEMETDDFDNDGPPPLTHVNELTNIIPSDASVKTLEICGLLKVIKSIDSTTFSCLVPPCVFSTENQDQFQVHCKEDHVYGVSGRSSTLCETCGMEINTTEDANLLENLFKHTIVHHADFLTRERSTKPPNRMLRIRKLSGDALSVIKKDEEPEEKVTASEMNDINEPSPGIDTENKSPDANDQVEDNPFPFKISGVMSLAEPQPQLPPLTPIVKPTVPILVKEAKMTAAEISKPKKTQKALAKFIEDVGNLYKCPYYYCVFTTNFREFLERHLKAHNLEKDYMVPCVYCDLKTPWEHVAIHIDIRHANCKYACSYCLYRACLKNYVFLHQDRAHPQLDYSVIALPASKAAKKFAIADIKIDPKTLCEPYKCLPACNIEFLFENEFNEHLSQQHQGFLTCGHDDCSSRVMVSKMIHHWSVAHAISVYQCSYCKTNSNELNLMYHHLSQTHQNLNPEILVRIISPKPDNLLLCYSAEAFKRMRRIATLPNITEGEKDDVPAMVQEPVKTTPYLPTLQVVTSAPQTNNLSRPILLSTAGNMSSASTVTTSNAPQNNLSRPILLATSGNMPPASTVTTSSGNLYLVTNSPVGGLKANTTTQNSLLKVNTTIQNPLLKVTSPSLMKVNAAGQNSLMNANGGQMNLSVIGSSNQATSAITSKALTLPTQPSTIPPLNSSVQTEVPNLTETAQSSAIVVPLEHVTLNEETNQDDVSECDVDPLDLGDVATSKTATYSSEDESDGAKSKSGLLGYQLFRCAVCEFSCSNCSDFRKHAAKSADCLSTEHLNKPYICIHCKKAFRSPHILAEHIQCHGVHRYSCSLCATKFPSSSQARTHMKMRHNINQTTQILLQGKLASGCEEFIIKPKSQMSESVPKETVHVEFPLSSAITDNIYGPDEIEKIPIRSIFSSDLKCGICTYSTKVRTNMVRHLQFHSQEKAVPDSAPVNPVPCLEKNEKMFDKMINLASSSHKSKMGGGGKSEKDVDSIPEFVASHTRYTCCAQGCNYICPEEANLRHHLMALHDGETSFVCVHCKAQLTPTDADSLIKHLKLHGLQLYKCHYCNVVHYFKHKVEKHCNDAHSDMPNKVLTVRHLEAEPVKPDEASSSSTSPVTNQTKSNKLWRCLMCKFKTATEEGVRIHVLEKHEIETQYKCALCAYKTDDKSTFALHYKDHHPKEDIDIIHTYRKVEEEKECGDSFDTTPLWQRDRPRIKHIRGILFDEAAPTPASKSPKKSSTKTATSINAKSATRNLDMSIESVASGSGNVRKDEGIEFIEKVNKMLKDVPISPVKATNDVIVIDDDDDTRIVSQKVAAKRKSTESIHQTAKVVKTEDTNDVGSRYAAADGDDIDDENLEKNLKLAFGQYGLPLNKQLKCPVCNKFKSKRISDFIFHLFKEKRVYRYKCGLCGDESITYRYMSKHVKEHEEDFNLDYVITMDRNPKLELWLQMLIRSQCTKIVPSLTPTLTVPPSELNKVLCRYCNRWYKSEQERNEHALTHWSCIPFKCGDCQFTSYSRTQIDGHCAKFHADATPNIIEMGPTVAGELLHADYLHMKEVEDELVEPIMKEASIAQVLVPTTTISDMIDESEQDGTVLGMANILEPDVNIMDVDPPFENVDDLVIVSKTDRNVPQNGDVYCCEYCPYMSNSEPIMLSHISGQHDNMHIKFKVLNQRTCFLKKDEFVACMICDEVGSEIQIRQHHMKVHDGETFLFYRYVCNACNKKFCRVTGLKLHSQRVHPGVPVTYTGLFNNIIGDVSQKVTKEKKAKASNDATPSRNLLTVLTPTVRSWKRYVCTECSYQRDFPPSGVNNVRCHVKTHFKPYLCGVCGLKSKSKTDSLSHFRTNHTGLAENIIHDKDAEDSFQECMRIIHSEAMPIPDPNAAVVHQPVKGKIVAKKSTSTRYVPPMEEFSYYGHGVEKEDMFKIMTTVEINGICLDMTADKLGKIFDLNPIVALEKCDAEPPIIEIDS